MLTPEELDRASTSLGLAPGESLQRVELAYKKLKSRCDPIRFASGSNEELQAKQISKRLDEIYQKLREALT